MGLGGMIVAQNVASSNQLQASMNESRERAHKDEMDLARLSSGADRLYFSDKFDGVVQATETDSDGKFKLVLEKGKKAVLVAVKDDLAWAIWITPDRSRPTITLSNKNLSGSGCDECVFGGTVTPKSLAVN